MNEELPAIYLQCSCGERVLITSLEMMLEFLTKHPHWFTVYAYEKVKAEIVL